MTDLVQHVRQSIQEHRLCRRGEKILVAVSGGLDSMALLRLLHTLSSEFQWKLAVAHFNHRLRGRSSLADEQLVRRTARTLKLPLVVAGADVRRFAARSTLSLEMAARRLRHEFLARAAREQHAQAIALAHHADDQVELFFLRLLRGAGGTGLAGMKWRAPSPVANNLHLVRPLLDLSKAQLQAFARAHRVRFREDASNFRLDALRNRLRNELLPLLRRRYQPALSRMVLRLMEIVSAESELVGSAAEDWLREAMGRGRTGRSPSKLAFDRLPTALQRRVLQLQLMRLGLPLDFELIERLRGRAGRPVSVGPACFISRDAGGRLQCRSRGADRFDLNECELRLNNRAGLVSFDGVRVRWCLAAGRGVPSLRKEMGREWFDAGQVGEVIRLRHWRPGDRFRPIGCNAAVKLQDWFVNQKIPRARRRQLLLAATQTGEIFWIEGLRIGEAFKLTAQTRHCLHWRWRRIEPAVSGTG